MLLFTISTSRGVIKQDMILNKGYYIEVLLFFQNYDLGGANNLKHANKIDLLLFPTV